jgi:hypothetical protein
MTHLRNSTETYAARRRASDATDHYMRDIGSYAVIAGGSKPVLAGKRSSWHYETRGGSYISHPSAYAKSGWSNMVYCSASWYTLTVGIDWLRRHCRTRAEKRALRHVMETIGRDTDAARAKSKTRKEASRVYTGPAPLAQRLASYKAACAAARAAAEFAARQAEFAAAGFELTAHKSYGGQYTVSAPALPAHTYRWYNQYATIPSVGTICEQYAACVREAEIRYADQLTADAAKYDAACKMPEGKVRFDAEGGFRVENN